MTGAQTDDLGVALNRLRTKIQQIRDSGESIGEENTKAVLIEPLLLALGWDVLDIGQVKREYRLKPRDNPVDYALFVLSNPRLFLEAKGLEQDIEDRNWITQTINYANNAGVEWCVLANGDEYRIYNTHARVPVEEKLYKVIRVCDQAKADETKRELNLLSKENIERDILDEQWKVYSIDREIQKALVDMVSVQENSLIRLLRKKTKLKKQDIQDSLRRARVKIDFPRAVGPPAEPHSVPPTQPRTSKAKQRLGGRSAGVRVKLAELIQAGLVNPPMEIETQYKGLHLKAVIQQDGTVSFDGHSYDSLSTAAGMARKTVIGAPSGRKYPQTNGWTFWKYRDPQSGKLKEVDHLRQQYFRSK